MDKPLLSLCIPTNGVAKWVIPVLDNIYTIAEDLSIFEVVVADNGQTTELDEPIKRFEHYDNFKYIKTKVEGFYNIVENFRLSTGDFMIKLNHRCIIHKGMIEYIYEQGCKNIAEKPLMYFSNGVLSFNGIKHYSTFDDFLYDLSYESSRSQGLFFWRSDLDRIPYIQFAKMSPNVSLLFDSRVKKHFVLDNTVYCHEMDETGKFGYDLFDTFAVHYLDLINEVRIDGYVSNNTFCKIKKDIFSALRRWYFYMRVLHHQGNYDLSNAKKSMMVYYTTSSYYNLVFQAYTVGLVTAIVKKIRIILK